MFGASTSPEGATPRGQSTPASGSPGTGPPGLKRGHSETSPGLDEAPHRRRRNPVKVSRACDFCKLRKSKCNGMIPCDKCVRKGRTCLYDTKYSRGRPPTPPPSASQIVAMGPADIPGAAPATPGLSSASPALPEEATAAKPDPEPPAAPSRASPELDMAEIQGQVLDPTSSVTFLHRAWRRLSRQQTAASDTPAAPAADHTSHQQPWMLAGDKPLPQCHPHEPDRIALPRREKTQELLSLYFDVCIATYRFLHRGTTRSWLGSLEWNLRSGKPAWASLGKPRAAIVLTVLAIASIHQEKSGCAQSPRVCADELFGMASRLTDTETGFPSLESAQARLIQVLYLLTTSRMNRAWYTFGNVVQIIAALGLHRRPKRERGLGGGGEGDYIRAQCSVRTFWAAYILDQHLGVIFGRPRHYHDEDIDQEFPASVNDELMTAQGPIERSEDDYGDVGSDCLIDALIFHAKYVFTSLPSLSFAAFVHKLTPPRIAQIIGQVSKEVYTIKATSEQDRVSAAHRLGKRLHAWRASLPPHLGSIRPSSLIPSLRRQATVLRLAYSHAVMHANRLFLLGNLGASSEPQVAECISAARVVFETVDGLAREGPLFHAFWWTHYVTFCALLVTYVWEIQQARRGGALGVEGDHGRLLELASRCHRHLANATATNSPSRKYAVILEEFRREATGRVSRHASPPHRSGEQTARPSAAPSDASHMNGWDAAQLAPVDGMGYAPGYDAGMADDGMPSFQLGPNLLDEWQTTDWLDLDSSVCLRSDGMTSAY